MSSRPLFERTAAATVSGLAIGLAQPDWGFWPLAFLALGPFSWCLRGQTLAGRLWLGWCAGTVATLTTPWIPGAQGFASFFELSLPWGGLAAFGVAQVFGAGSAMVAAGLTGGALPSTARAIRFALAWATGEWLRCIAFSGLPWMLLGYGLAPVPQLAQLAAVFGVLGVSAALALVGAGTADLLSPRVPGRRAGTALVLGVTLIGLPALYRVVQGPQGEGSVVVAAEQPASGEVIRIALIQGGRPSVRKPRPGEVSASAAQLVRQTRSVGAVDLVVWPESAIAAPWPANRALVAGAFDGSDVPWLLLGAPRFEDGHLFNAALLLDATGATIDSYDKVRLLPFGERALPPLKPTAADLSPGSRLKLLRAASTALGPLICYEILFEELARAHSDAGARLLVNLSNEAWFGSVGAMEQNLAAAVFRAIETGRPVLRATRTGLTAAIDARGNVVVRLVPDTPGEVVVDARPANATTIYRRIGFRFPAIAALASGSASLLLAWRRRKGIPSIADQ